MTRFNQSLQLLHGSLALPAFLPDATLGVVRSLDSQDLENCGIPALVMNAFHLMQHPGSSTVQALGGLHQMCGWSRPIVTDSGGFQAYSMIRQNAKYGRLTDRGILFRPEGSNRKLQLTPEKAIQLQLSYGADILFCLDDCTHPDDSLATQEESVARTIQWAKRCKQEFLRLIEQKQLSETQRPLLFAVIQGGNSQALRQQCADELLAIGFDGYGYGGWPLDSQGNLLTEMLQCVRDRVPSHLPLHALGIGHPANVAIAAQMGYDLFDCAMPTRDARHGRLYVFNQPLNELRDRITDTTNTSWFSYCYVQDKKYIKTKDPISPHCDSLCCSRYSLGYLNHLFEVKDTSFLRLATLHNLRFMVQLMQVLNALRTHETYAVANPH